MKSAASPVCGAISSACLSSSSGSTSLPSTVTERSQVRWFRPTWPSDTSPGPTPSSEAKSRWNPMATLHRPTARWPADSRARVTIPTGLVKSMMKAAGEARRAARSAKSRTMGTVRSAFASPPAPVVSCPTQPQSSGQVSSRWRAAWPPIRSWNKIASAPSVPSSRSPVQLTRAGWSWAAMIRADTGPTAARRPGSGSTSTSSATSGSSRPIPSASSGV